MHDILFKNAQITTPNEYIEGDVLLNDGKIVRVAPSIDEQAKRVIDLDGKFLIPGVIDVHVHFRTPGAEYKEDWKTGSRAAVFGGVTTVFDMPNNTPPALTTAHLDNKRMIAGRDSFCNFGFYIGTNGKNFEDIKVAENIVGVKLYMGSSTNSSGLGSPEVMNGLFSLGKLITVHAEDDAIIAENMKKFDHLDDPMLHSVVRSNEAAYAATKTAIDYAEKHGTRLHIAHMSTREELAAIRQANNHRVSCEVMTHHLFLNRDAYAKWGNYVRMNPPLRSKEDVLAMWEGLALNEIDMVATDHAPHTREEKDRPYMEAPSGVPGVETLLPLMLEAVSQKRCTLKDVVKWLSFNPAQRFDVRNKGAIREGYDADLVVVDMSASKVLRDEDMHTKCGWSCYSGMEVHGLPVMTVVGGKIVVEDGKINEDVRGTEVQFDR